MTTSKSGPYPRHFATFDFEMCFAPQRRARFPHRNLQKSSKLVCFAIFNFQMCFAPQRRALFPHYNVQKCSETKVLWHFLLENVLRATMTCNFSFHIWPAPSAPAALASLLFDPPEPRNTGKTHCFDFLCFSYTCIFFLLTFLHFWASAELAYIFISLYCRKFGFQISFD